jgi:sugar-specific transcriptional regulator TrmB
MEDKLLIQQLLNFNFTEYEARALVVLLKKSSLTATEISSMAGIPRTKVYEVLNNLTAKGFCSEIPGSIRRFKAIPPDLSFKTLFTDIENKKRELENLEKTLTPLFYASRSDSDPLDYIEIVRKKEVTIDKINNYINKAKHSLMIMNKIPYYNKLESYFFDNKVNINIKKDITYRYLFQIRKKVKPTAEEMAVFKFLNDKENVYLKFAYELPLKFFCVDEKIVFISLKDKVKVDETMTALVIDHDDLANACKILFGLSWDNAFDFNTLKENFST